MSRSFSASVASAITLSFVLLSGCSKPTHESLQVEGLSKMKDLTAILKGVTDESSAKAAGPKIKALGEELKALREQADALPKISAEDQKALSEKHASEIKDTTQAMMKELSRVMMNPELSKPIAEAMKDFQSSAGRSRGQTAPF